MTETYMHKDMSFTLM